MGHKSKARACLTGLLCEVEDNDLKVRFLSFHPPSESYPYINLVSNGSDRMHRADRYQNRILGNYATTDRMYMDILDECWCGENRVHIPLLVHKFLSDGADVMFFGSYLLHQESNCAEYHIRASSMDRSIPIGPSLSRSNQPNDDPEPEETHPWEKDWYVPFAQPDVQQTAATQPLTSEGMGPTAPRWGQRSSQSTSQIYDLPVNKAPTPHIQPQDRTGSSPT